MGTRDVVRTGDVVGMVGTEVCGGHRRVSWGQVGIVGVVGTGECGGDRGCGGHRWARWGQMCVVGTVGIVGTQVGMVGTGCVGHSGHSGHGRDRCFWVQAGIV